MLEKTVDNPKKNFVLEKSNLLVVNQNLRVKSEFQEFVEKIQGSDIVKLNFSDSAGSAR